MCNSFAWLHKNALGVLSVHGRLHNHLLVFSRSPEILSDTECGWFSDSFWVSYQSYGRASWQCLYGTV